MTARTAPGTTQFPIRKAGAAIAASLGIAVVLAFSQPWQTGDQPETRVINPAPAFVEHEQYIASFLATENTLSFEDQAEMAVAEHSAAFPLPPSDGGLSGPMSLAEAIAQHGALIDGWLSRAS